MSQKIVAQDAPLLHTPFRVIGAMLYRPHHFLHRQEPSAYKIIIALRDNYHIGKEYRGSIVRRTYRPRLLESARNRNE